MNDSPSPSPHGSPPKVPAWRVGLALVITAAVVGLLIHEVGGVAGSVEAMSAANWTLAPLPVALMALILLLVVQKWRVVLAAMGYELSLRRGLYAMLVSLPVAAITPSRAGDFLRAKVVEHEVPIVRAVGSVLCDRLVDIHNLVLLATGGAVLTANWVAAGMLASGLVLAWMLLGAALKWRDALLQRPGLQRVREPLAELLEATVAVLNSPRHLAGQFALSLINWVTVLSVLYSLNLVFHAGLGWLEILALWPLATLFGLIPLTLSGIGTRDAAFIYLIVSSGHSAPAESAIVLTTIVYALISSWMWAVVGLPFSLHWMTRSPDDATD